MLRTFNDRALVARIALWRVKFESIKMITVIFQLKLQNALKSSEVNFGESKEENWCTF